MPGLPRGIDHDAGEPAHGADEAHGAHYNDTSPRITRPFHSLDMISSPVWLDIKVVNKNSTEFLRCDRNWFLMVPVPVNRCLSKGQGRNSNGINDAVSMEQTLRG